MCLLLLDWRVNKFLKFSRHISIFCTVGTLVTLMVTCGSALYAWCVVTHFIKLLSLPFVCSCQMFCHLDLILAQYVFLGGNSNWCSSGLVTSSGRFWWINSKCFLFLCFVSLQRLLENSQIDLQTDSHTHLVGDQQMALCITVLCTVMSRCRINA